jgi:hypothetical protein
MWWHSSYHASDIDRLWLSATSMITFSVCKHCSVLELSSLHRAGALLGAMPSVFEIWCPLGHACAKGGGQLAKRDTAAGVLMALKSHLMNSPYHDLLEEEADAVVESAEVEETTWENVENVEVVGETHGRPRLASPTTQPKKRARLPLALSEPSSGHRGPSSSQSATSGGIITMSGQQVSECIDSITRAQSAAHQAARLCQSAATAFDQEALALGSCKMFFENKLHHR